MNKTLLIIAIVILVVGSGAWYLNKLLTPIGPMTHAPYDYIYKNQAQCAALKCNEGLTPFYDAIGCGCENRQVPFYDWQTYRNEEYGFEVKYPSDWLTERYENMTFVFATDPVNVVSFDVLKTADVSPGLVSISVQVPGEAPNVLVDRYNNLPWPELTIGENNAIKAKRNEQSTGNDTPNPTYNNRHLITYELIKNKNAVTISYNSDLQDKYLGVFNQILSTFKFTK